MAGVTDRPFRSLCRRLGAGMAASEMVSSNSLLWGSTKTKRRADHAGVLGEHALAAPVAIAAVLLIDTGEDRVEGLRTLGGARGCTGGKTGYCSTRSR